MAGSMAVAVAPAHMVGLLTVTVGGGTTGTPSATPITVITPITSQPQPTLAPTGPGDKIISLGALGIIFSIIGAVILFAL